MKIKRNIIEKNIGYINGMTICKIILILQNIAIFYPDIIKAMTSLQIVCLFLYLLCFFLINRRIKIFKYMLLWLIFMVTVILNLFVGGELSYILVLCINTILLVFLLNMPELVKTELKIIKACTFVHLIASLFAYIFPQAVVDAVFQILLGSSFSLNYSWRVIQNSNPGITTQPGLNAISLTVLFLICVVEILISNKKKLPRIICMCMSYLMIITTAKRSAIIFSLIAAVIFMLYVNKEKLKYISVNKVLTAILMLVAIIAFATTLISSNFVNSVIYKMKILTEAGDITNGRIGIWKNAIGNFANSPVFGIGFKNIYKGLGVDVHNSYIQILAESGIIGFVFFTLGMFGIVMHTVRSVDYIIYQSYDNELKECVGVGFMLIIFLLIYGMVGNVFIEYYPLSLFCLGVFMSNAKRGGNRNVS